jgi:hypothetical protein
LKYKYFDDVFCFYPFYAIFLRNNEPFDDPQMTGFIGFVLVPNNSEKFFIMINIPIIFIVN